jgi:hypothetical protein
MRWLGGISFLLLLQIAFLVFFLAITGRLPQRELGLVWQAIWSGTEPEETDSSESAKAKPKQEPSYAEYLRERTLEARLVEDKIKELESLRRVVATEASDVDASSKRLSKIRDALEKDLKNEDEALIEEGKEKRLSLLQSMPPKLAKSYLLEQGRKDEKVVIEILKQMDDVVAAKIFREFKLPQEIVSLNNWLEKLGEGEPDASRLRALREQLPPRS